MHGDCEDWAVGMLHNAELMQMLRKLQPFSAVALIGVCSVVGWPLPVHHALVQAARALYCTVA